MKKYHLKGLKSFDFESPKMIKHLNEIPKYLEKDKFLKIIPTMCQTVKVKGETLKKFSK